MRKLLLITIFACLAFSCEDEVYSNIPWAQVNLKLELNGRDASLGESLATKVFLPRKDERFQTDRLGYGGILIVNGLGIDVYNLKAYDLSCPEEASPEVVLKPGDKNGLATCPKCGAVYDISTTGVPISGSKHYLKQYNVSMAPGISGTYVVTN